LAQRASQLLSNHKDLITKIVELFDIGNIKESSSVVSFKNCAIGTINDKLFIRNHLPDDYTFKVSQCYYPIQYKWDTPEVKEMMGFLHKVHPDPDTFKYFISDLALLLKAHNSGKRFRVWKGGPKSGKKVLVELLKYIFGLERYAFVFTRRTLIAGQKTDPIYGIDNLVSGRVGFITEDCLPMNITSVRIWSDSESNFYAREPYSNDTQKKSYLKPIYVADTIGPFGASHEAIMNRVIIVPFKSLFDDNAPKDQKDQVEKRHFPSTDFETRIPTLAPALLWIMLNSFHDCEQSSEIKDATNDYWKQLSLRTSSQKEKDERKSEPFDLPNGELDRLLKSHSKSIMDKAIKEGHTLRELGPCLEINTNGCTSKYPYCFGPLCWCIDCSHDTILSGNIAPPSRYYIKKIMDEKEILSTDEKYSLAPIRDIKDTDKKLIVVSVDEFGNCAENIYQLLNTRLKLKTSRVRCLEMIKNRVMVNQDAYLNLCTFRLIKATSISKSILHDKTQLICCKGNVTLDVQSFSEVVGLFATLRSIHHRLHSENASPNICQYIDGLLLMSSNTQARRSVSLKLKEHLASEKCYCCETKILPGFQVLAHIEPHRNGGDESKDNLVYTCFKCNFDMTTTNLFEWMYRSGKTSQAFTKDVRAQKHIERIQKLDRRILKICPSLARILDSKYQAVVKIIFESYSRFGIDDREALAQKCEELLV
jgi:hypothetical protein